MAPLSREIQGVRGEAVAYYDNQQRAWRFTTVAAATLSRHMDRLVLDDGTQWEFLRSGDFYTHTNSAAKTPEVLYPADFVNGALGRYHGETDPTPRRKETSDPAAEGFAAAKRENAAPDPAYVEALENLLREARRQLYDAQKARIKSEALIAQINQLFGS